MACHDFAMPSIAAVFLPAPALTIPAASWPSANREGYTMFISFTSPSRDSSLPEPLALPRSACKTLHVVKTNLRKVFFAPQSCTRIQPDRLGRELPAARTLVLDDGDHCGEPAAKGALGVALAQLNNHPEQRRDTCARDTSLAAEQVSGQDRASLVPVGLADALQHQLDQCPEPRIRLVATTTREPAPWTPRNST